MEQFDSVYDFVQRLVMNIIYLSNRFPKVLGLFESLVTVISYTAQIFNVRISEVLTVCMQHDLYIVLLSATTTFKRNTFIALETLQSIQIILLWSRNIRITVFLNIVIRMLLLYCFLPQKMVLHVVHKCFLLFLCLFDRIVCKSS